MKNIMSLLIIVLATGCTTGGRIAGDLVGAAGGGYLGNRLSNGNPIATAGGAAAGVATSEVISWATTKAQRRAYDAGYRQARGDLAREQYWTLRNLHNPKLQPEGQTFLYPIPVPETQVDGAVIQPTVRYLRIQQ